MKIFLWVIIEKGGPVDTYCRNNNGDNLEYFTAVANTTVKDTVMTRDSVGNDVDSIANMDYCVYQTFSNVLH